MRFVVFSLPGNDRGWMADDFADALRAPLGAIGVRVVRQHRFEDNPSMSGFQAHGLSAKAYKIQSEKVRNVVEDVLNFRRAQS
jgi:hypothetical protein